jgi:intracellular multiplication protein IcmK
MSSMILRTNVYRKLAVLVLFSLGITGLVSAENTNQLSLQPVGSVQSQVVASSSKPPIKTLLPLSMETPSVLNPNQLFRQPTTNEKIAFRAVTKKALPMTPTQIQQMKVMMATTQRAAASAAGVPPKPVTSSLIVKLAPGSTPPVIRLAQGFITSLVFVDASGNKWPIEGYDIGNPNSFNIQWQNKSNTLLIQASSMYNYGNLAVKLQGLTTPVMLTLVPGQSVVDYRVDLHVSGLSPTSHVTSGGGFPSPASNALLSVLNGVPPKNAKALQVAGGRCDASLNNCQAWLAGSTLYLRIPMTILSPAWNATMKSSDGMKAYAMQKTPSLLVSDYGKTKRLKIEGF